MEPKPKPNSAQIPPEETQNSSKCPKSFYFEQTASYGMKTNTELTCQAMGLCVAAMLRRTNPDSKAICPFHTNQ